MRRIAIIIISLLFVCLSDTTAFACGDKFLLVGRGARYQRGYTAVHPASILLYASTAATSQRSLQSALKLAGHRVVVAATRGELGYFVTPALSVRALGLWQETHGGFALPREFHEGEFEIHDRVAKAQYIRYGLGATYAINRTVGVFALVLNTYSGKSTYASRGGSAGVTWNFGRHRRSE